TLRTWFAVDIDNVVVKTLTSGSGTLNITCNHPYSTFTITPPIPPATTGGSCYQLPAFTNVPGGPYTVTFNPPFTRGYNTPAPHTQTLNANTVAFDGVYTLIPGSTVDTDGDGLRDEWELGTSLTRCGTLDLSSIGANPFHKDIFIQVDSFQRSDGRSTGVTG